MSLAEQLIGDLADGGFVESHGRFTLDVQAARRKLAELTLADPYQWVLKMAQAASLLHCTELSLTTSGNELGLRFEGMRVSLEEFSDCLQGLAIESQTGGLSHLSQAVHALRRRCPQGVVMRAAQPGHTFAMEGDRLLSRPTDPHWRAQPMLTMVLPRSRSWMQREWPEVEWLRQRASAAPFRISHNLQRWSKSVISSRQPPTLFSFLSPPPRYALQLLVDPSSRDMPLLRDRPLVDSPGQGSSLLHCDFKLRKFSIVRRWFFNGEVAAVVSVPKPRPRHGRLHVWLDGVLSEAIVMEDVPCDAIIGRQGLSCDLSGLRMVENESLRQRIQWVAQSHGKLLKAGKQSGYS